LLFGEHDQHLARLERELGVSMVSRGNQLIISGAEDSVTVARQILTGLYQRLKRGQHLDKHDIDAAIRLSRQDDAPAPTRARSPICSAPATSATARRSRLRSA
jgi:phosphate starvation-inducible PhoH-like protein